MRPRRLAGASVRPLNFTVRSHTMDKPHNRPKLLAGLLAGAIVLVGFLGISFAAALLAGFVCGASVRLHLPWATFNCKYLAPMFVGVAFFAYLFAVPGLVNTLRSLLTRVPSNNRWRVP